MLPEIIQERSVISVGQEKAFIDRFQLVRERMLSHPFVEQGLERMSAMSQEQHDVFTYHNRVHVDGVVSDSLLFWTIDHRTEFQQDPLPFEQLRLMRNLAIAAAYHDTGFTKIDFVKIRTAKGHEKRSVDIFIDDFIHSSPELQNAFSPEDLVMITGAILGTELQFIDGKLVQQDIPPQQNPIASYLQDADVSNFGDERFERSTVRVYQEETRLKTRTEPRSRRSFPDFLQGTLDLLLLPHEWKTDAARQLLQQGEEENIEKVRTRLGIATPIAVSAIAEE